MALDQSSAHIFAKNGIYPQSLANIAKECDRKMRKMFFFFCRWPLFQAKGTVTQFLCCTGLEQGKLARNRGNVKNAKTKTKNLTSSKYVLKTRDMC